jgi:DNA-binding response OmpR family regulator
MTLFNAPARPRKIMVVDDDSDILDFVTRLLSDAGHTVVAAHGHAEFQTVFNASTLPDLILLDIRMPEHDGFWIAEYVKSKFDIPIIFMTAHHHPKYQLYAPMAGAAAYILKPFEPDLLLSTIDKVLGLNRTETSVGAAR